MKNTTLAIAALVITSGLAPQAQACRVMRTPEQRITDAYSFNKALKVAIVRIRDARHLSNEMTRKLKMVRRDYEPPWRATAIVTRVVTGEASPELVVFDRNWGSAACDDGTTMPGRGDRWVVYYTSQHSLTTATVVESYPLKVAMATDPRLRDMMR